MDPHTHVFFFFQNTDKPTLTSALGNQSTVLLKKKNPKKTNYNLIASIGVTEGKKQHADFAMFRETAKTSEATSQTL